MIKKFSAPRGTYDILPENIPAWEMVENNARRILKTYGYREIRTPIYEETALFKRSLGQTSDIVHKQLLELATDDVGAINNRPYALRPEGTASVVRSYIENDLDKKEPLSKLFYIGPMFRGERPQKGRLRQFHQIGVEAIGPHSASPYLDAEVIVLAIHLLKDFGINNPKLKINSLGSKEDKEHIAVWLRGELGKHKKELCEDCQDRFERNVFRVLDCKNEQCKNIAGAIINRLYGQGLPLSEASRKYFEQVQSCLKNAGLDFEISPSLVRGLDYYIHTVFEIIAEGLGSQDAVAAGGRYDGLIHELGGNEKIAYGAMGVALGIDRILLASGHRQEIPMAMDAFVISMDPKQAFVFVHLLRQSGISADMGFTGGSFKSQMNRANKLNARFALILGEEELKNKMVSMKNMSDGKQEMVGIEECVRILAAN